jgi:hypothetical protein
MNYRSGRPRRSPNSGKIGNDLRRLRRIAAKTACFVAHSGFNDIVAGDDPGTSDGILAKFHASKESKIEAGSQMRIL